MPRIQRLGVWGLRVQGLDCKGSRRLKLLNLLLMSNAMLMSFRFLPIILVVVMATYIFLQRGYTKMVMSVAGSSSSVYLVLLHHHSSVVVVMSVLLFRFIFKASYQN